MTIGQAAPAITPLRVIHSPVDKTFGGGVQLTTVAADPVINQPINHISKSVIISPRQILGKIQFP